MNKTMRVLILIITVSLLIGTLPSTSALASSSLASNNQTSVGQATLDQIKKHPCGTGKQVPNTVPLFVCSGYGGSPSWIKFPLRSWETSPAYPIANYPFYIALGTKAAPNYYRFPSNRATYPNVVDIQGIKTEIRLTAIKQELNPINDTNFNGMLELSPDGNMSTYSHKNLVHNRWHEEVEEKLLIFDIPKPESATTKDYYETAGGVIDTALLRAFSLNSSYFANNPTSFRGEPAYRVVIISYYKVHAKVSWQRHRFWEYLPDGTKTVCQPGQGSGESCVTSSGLAGHKVTETVYTWKWGDWHGGEESGWKDVGTGFKADSVLWPDGSIHDHIPILVYQSQPILTLP